MQITSCQYCGVLSDYDRCVENFEEKGDYYGDFTKCGNCGNCLYPHDVSKVAVKFEDAGD